MQGRAPGLLFAASYEGDAATVASCVTGGVVHVKRRSVYLQYPVLLWSADGRFDSEKLTVLKLMMMMMMKTMMVRMMMLLVWRSLNMSGNKKE